MLLSALFFTPVRTQHFTLVTQLSLHPATPPAQRKQNPLHFFLRFILVFYSSHSLKWTTTRSVSSRLNLDPVMFLPVCLTPLLQRGPHKNHHQPRGKKKSLHFHFSFGSRIFHSGSMDRFALLHSISKCKSGVDFFFLSKTHSKLILSPERCGKKTKNHH